MVFAGFAWDQAFPSPSREDVTINAIREVRCRIDGGSWQLGTLEDDHATFTVFKFAPESRPEPGSHRLEAQATNSAGKISTIAYHSFQVSGTADLRIPILALSQPVGADGSFLLEDRTENSGTYPAGGSTSRFYISGDCVLDPTDVEIGSRAVPPLAAGEASDASTEVKLLLGACPDVFSIIAVADADREVVEVEESNNALRLRLLASPSDERPPRPLGDDVIFLRGDVDLDGKLDLGDVLSILGDLYGGETPICLDHADGDGSGVIDLSDPLFILTYLFLGGPAPGAIGGDCDAESQVPSIGPIEILVGSR